MAEITDPPRPNLPHIVVLTPESFDDLTEEQISTLLKQADTLTKVFKGLREHALTLLQNGKKIPGFQLGASARSRVWKSEFEAVGAMHAAGIKDAYKRELLSVAEAEKKGDAEKLKNAWQWKPGNPAVKPT